jgi:hypothetical protein
MWGCPREKQMPLGPQDQGQPTSTILRIIHVRSGALRHHNGSGQSAMVHRGSAPGPKSSTDGCLPAPIPQRTNLRRSVPWRPPLATTQHAPSGLVSYFFLTGGAGSNWSLRPAPVRFWDCAAPF